MIKIYKNGTWINVSDGVDSIVLTPSQMQLVDDIYVPKLTPQELALAYNELVDSGIVFIADSLNQYYIVKQANTEDGNAVIYFDYKDSHVLRYELDNNSVIISAKEYGEGGGGAVSSVNGKVGAVVLNASDILVQNSQTIQANLERIDGSIEDLIDDVADVNDRIDALSGFGRELSGWDATTGLPITEPPTELPYEYRTGDYFIIENVEYALYLTTKTYHLGDKVKHNNLYYVCIEEGTTGIFDDNAWQTTTLVLYKPSGDEYDGTASTSVETESVKVLDIYRFDGTSWYLIKGEGVDLTNYAKTNESNTWTQEQTFSDNVYFKGWKIQTDVGGNIVLGYGNATSFKISANFIAPVDGKTNATIGTATNQFKDLYLSGTAYVVNIGSSAINGGKISFFDSGYSTITGNLYPTINNVYQLGYTQRVFTNVFTTALSDGTNSITIAELGKKPSVSTSTSTSYSGALTSNTLYKFSNALTSLGIITNGFVVQTGDNQPSWKIHLKIASGFTFTSADTIVWKSGTPNWNELVGEEIEILFEQSLVANTYNAWII